MLSWNTIFILTTGSSSKFNFVLFLNCFPLAQCSLWRRDRYKAVLEHFHLVGGMADRGATRRGMLWIAIALLSCLNVVSDAKGEDTSSQHEPFFTPRDVEIQVLSPVPEMLYPSGSPISVSAAIDLYENLVLTKCLVQPGACSIENTKRLYTLCTSRVGVFALPRRNRQYDVG